MANIKPFQPQDLSDSFFKRHDEFTGFGVLRPRTDEAGDFNGTYALNVIEGEAPRLALTVSQQTVDMFNLPVGTCFMYTIALNNRNPWNEGYGASFTLLSEGITIEDPLKLRKLKKEGKATIYPIYGLHEDARYQKALEAYDEGLANVMSGTAEEVPSEDDAEF